VPVRTSARESASAVPEVPGGLRIAGHALEFRRDPLGLFQRAREYGDVVRIRFGPAPVYVLNSPGAIRQALVGEARKLDKGVTSGRAKRLMGDGLVLSDGDLHQRQRRLMQPAFHRADIARYTRMMREVAVPRIDAWPDGGMLAFDYEMRSITLTVVTRALLSSDVGAGQISEIERLLHLLLPELMPKTLAQIPYVGRIPTRSNMRFDAARRRLGAILTQIIEGYRAAGGDHDDLMSILLRARDDQTGTGMTDRQLRDEATTLVLAGSETTGNTLAWACYLLTQHPEVAGRVQREADTVLGGDDADHDDLANLPLTRAVITEALRLYNPVWILPRRAAADVELAGYRLPAGSVIFFSPYALNRDAQVHRDPDRFDPDRWATDYTRSDMRASFFPFGQGIRNCLGEGFAWAETVLVLSAIAARWDLRLADGASVRPVASSTLVASELPIVVTRRSPARRTQGPLTR
jgi:cytochrome P450